MNMGQTGRLFQYPNILGEIFKLKNTDIIGMKGRVTLLSLCLSFFKQYFLNDGFDLLGNPHSLNGSVLLSMYEVMYVDSI